MVTSAETIPALSARGVSKAFPGVQALRDVDLEIQPGEIHALVGENGAGKSTLMRIVAGYETPDTGELLLDGELADVGHGDRGRRGVAMVHQERSLVESLSVAENMFVADHQTGPLGVIKWNATANHAREVFELLQESIDPAVKVSRLAPARQQVVEIAKALVGRPRVLILDEPTAALTLNETEHVFEVLRTLRAQGVAIIYISHRLAEVFEIADRVTVLKDGVVTGHHAVSEVDENRLIQLMVGRELSFARSSGRHLRDTPVVLEVEHLTARPGVVDASFRAHEGEIVCFAGLIGAGRSEACEAVFGIRPVHGGEIRVAGTPRKISSASEACALGLALVPEDRKESGLFLNFSILDNIAAGNLDRISRRGVIAANRARALAERVVEDLGVVAVDVDQKVGQLSGGNQQKLLIGRWLATDPRLLIVDEPTRGVDVGARAQIYDRLRRLAREGMAIIVVSSDLPEVLALADRIVVFREGRTVSELDGATATEEDVIRLAALETKAPVAA